MDPASLPLRDIHLPPAPSWWPPAPGWWLVAALTLVLLWVAARWLRRARAAARWRRRVRGELDALARRHAATPDPLALSAELSALLRRASRLVEPAAVALEGGAWLEFLDRQLPPAQAAARPFQSGPGRALVDLAYRDPRDPALAALDATALLALARTWLAAVLARSPARV